MFYVGNISTVAVRRSYETDKSGIRDLPSNHVPHSSCPSKPPSLAGFQPTYVPVLRVRWYLLTLCSRNSALQISSTCQRRIFSVELKDGWGPFSRNELERWIYTHYLQSKFHKKKRIQIKKKIVKKKKIPLLLSAFCKLGHNWYYTQDLLSGGVQLGVIFSLLGLFMSCFLLCQVCSVSSHFYSGASKI